MKTNAESRSESPVGSVVPRSPASAARRLTITYALAATGWLLVFDFLLDEFVKDDFWNRVLSAVLAMIFVAFTSVVLYVSWRRELEHLDHTRQALAATNAQLADRETRLNHLFEHAPLGIAVVRSGQLEFVNPTLARMFGFTDMPAMLAVPLSSLLAANSRAALAEFQSIGRAQAYRHELTAVRQDGSEFEVELNAKAIGQADGQAVLAFVTDITNRKLAEATLRVSEERLKSTMDSMLEGGQIIGFDWRYIYVNDALEVQGRQPREDLLGHTMMEAYPGIENTGLFAVLRRCMDGRQPERMETEFIFQDGSRGWFDLSIQPVSEGIFILSHDITARKRAEENIQRQLDRLAALRAIDLAITGSLDLRIALDVVVRQAVEQLSVDAAAVLLLDPITSILTYAAGHGFRTAAIKKSACAWVKVMPGRRHWSAAWSRSQTCRTPVPGSSGAGCSQARNSSATWPCP